jgi:uncharacterized membrane protein YgcG
MARASLGLLGIALMLIAFPGGACDAGETAEKILSFSSRITVNPDASMTVSETIRVRVTGEEIKRGIYRDFPTTYTDPSGNRYVVGFVVASVTRDGKPEVHHTEKLANGVRIYMGRKDYRLPPGEHGYTFSYTTNRQLGFFREHDELYWNVTGNGWNFQIDAVEAAVAPPPGVPSGSLALEAYTGPSGAKGRDYRAAVAPDGSAVFRTTRPLAPGEGLTIVVGWPKGFVAEPSAGQKTVRAIRDHLTLLVSGVGLLCIMGYYLLVWSAVGKDPAKGSIMPLYTPPDTLSPAAMRFISEMGYDDKVFAAALIDMAVKGRLDITDTDNTYTLLKKEARKPKLSAEEEKIAAQLFRGASSIALERRNHARIGAAKNALKSSLTLTFEKTHFVGNQKAFITGVVLSAAATAMSLLSAHDQGEVVFLGIWLTGWSVGVFFLAAMVVKLWRGVFAGARSLGTKVGSLGAAVFMTLFALPFFGAEIVVLAILAKEAPALAAFPLAAAGLNMLFYHLLKAPTLLGRRVLDRIEGFKMFLGATEADRFERLYPAGRTPDQFEKYLPYAIALGVEQQWTEQFADVLARAAQADGAGYRPLWYSGSWDSSRIGNFAGAVGSSLSGAISSSASAPGSSSGSGGGGSSGGGGGGGGGGAW